MQFISRFLPPSYVFESLRNIVFNKHVSGSGLFIGAGLAMIYIFLACLFFISTYKHAVRTGLIARYSVINML